MGEDEIKNRALGISLALSSQRGRSARIIACDLLCISTHSALLFLTSCSRQTLVAATAIASTQGYRPLVHFHFIKQIVQQVTGNRLMQPKHCDDCDVKKI